MLRITSSFVCLDLFDGFAQFPKKLGYRVTYIETGFRMLCRGERRNSTMFYLVCEILRTLDRALFKLD